MISESEMHRYSESGVQVNYLVLSPRFAERPAHSEQQFDTTLVLFPGWMINADSRSAITVGQSFADTSGRNVIVIDTKPQNILDNSLFKESQAAERIIKENGVRRLTIVGHSEGGIRAANLATILQDEKSGVNVEGVILMVSGGLYKQKGTDLFSVFFRNVIQEAHRIKNGNSGRKPTLMEEFYSGTGFALTFLREVAKYRGKFPQRLLSQIKEMARIAQNLANLKVPVVLIQGADDPISSPEKTLPGYRGMSMSQREKALKKRIFPNSPSVRMIVGSNFPYHSLPLFRSAQIARVSLHSLGSLKKPKLE